MKKFVLAMLLALVTTPLFGEVNAKIVGDAQVQPGDMVLLNGSHSSDAVHYIWKLLNADKKFYVFEDGKVLVTAIGTPGKYRYLLIVVGQDNNGNIKVDEEEFTVTVGDPEPEPDPPNPEPDIEPDQFENLGQKIWQWQNLVLHDKAKTVASKVGDNYIAVSKDLAAGDVMLNEVFSRVKKKNESVWNSTNDPRGTHDQYVLLASRINNVWDQYQDDFTLGGQFDAPRDGVVRFLEIVGNTLRKVSP